MRSTIIIISIILSGCNISSNLNTSQSNFNELYSMHPDGLVKINITPEILTLVDTDCLESAQEINVLKMIKDDRIQDYILRSDTFPSPRDTCIEFQIIHKIESSKFSNLFHYILENDWTIRRNKGNYVYSIKYNEHNTITTRCSVNEINVNKLDFIFNEVFQLTYYSKNQISQLDDFCDPQKADSTSRYNYFVEMNENKKYYTEKLKRSSELKLTSMYGSLESLEIAKNNLYDIGCNPFTTSRVISNFISGTNKY